MTGFAPRLRIGVIGAGISGLSAAWALSRHHEVTLIEAEPRLGGHANTAEILLRGVPTPVDTGFIVFNDWTYPNFIALMSHLGVAVEPSNMSFAVSLDDGAYEYASETDPAALFAQKRNALRPSHWRMLLDMKRFYAEGPTLDERFDLEAMSLGALLQALSLSEAFIKRHIIPMCACIWSGSFDDMLAFPARTFVHFFRNHGLFLLEGRPQWRTISGGSQRYIAALLKDFRGRLIAGAPVSAVERRGDIVAVHRQSGETLGFDHVVMATHGDTACTLVKTKTAAEASILQNFRTSDNLAILHKDASLMPKRRRVWSSWNYVAARDEAAGAAVPITYWMNRLQNLDPCEDVFVSLNPRRAIDPAKILYQTGYRHPVFDAAAIAAQSRLPEIQGKDRISWCGAWQRYGFHEDGCMSGLAVARQLGAVLPWDSQPVMKAAA